MEMEDKWSGKHWSAEEDSLINLVGKNEELFLDMLFAKGTMCYPYIIAETSGNNGQTRLEYEHPLPEPLEYFSYSFFDFRVNKLDGSVFGYFNADDQSITVDPDSLHCEARILHELIHLHEFVLNEQPLFYHEVYFYCLYRSLQSQIDDLDERIKSHGHILNEEALLEYGGLHDILFLLKSFDLDLKKGYKLGTVFAYGYDQN